MSNLTTVANTIASPFHMVPALTSFDDWVPVLLVAVMGLAMLAYTVLDGYDLGVGILMRRGAGEQRDMMIASIGPFWDANETWLVLGVGILLTSFPMAHGIILGALYLPVSFMLIGLILRGVAFDFRVKAQASARPLWNSAFYAGSLIASLSQGWMLGHFITGFASGWAVYTFCALIALCLVAGYTLLGATWLVMKTEGELQQRSIAWAKGTLAFTAIGVLSISLATPILSETIFARWFTLPYIVLLIPIPAATLLLFFICWRSLGRLPKRLADGNRYGEWVPFACTVGIFLLAFYGLAYSLFPYLIIDRMTLWQAASAPEALRIIFFGGIIVLPVIVGYTVYAYRVFGGKVRALSYE